MPLVGVALTNLYKKKMRDAFSSATKDASAFVRLLMKNNPTKTDGLLTRPDLHYALSMAMEQALSLMQPVLEQAALAGGIAGHSDGDFQTSILADLLGFLHRDLLKIVQSIPDEVESAIRSGDASEVTAAFKRLELRATYVAEAALKWGASFTQTEEMRFSDTRAMWVVTSDNPCSFCLALNGQIREWGKPFKIAGLKQHRASRGVPPIHPNCRCHLVPV